MTPYQKFAVECAVIDLVYSIECSRSGLPVDEKPLLDSINDLRSSFPEMADRINRVTKTLKEAA